jgi:hypothetical protein
MDPPQDVASYRRRRPSSLTCCRLSNCRSSDHGRRHWDGQLRRSAFCTPSFGKYIYCHLAPGGVAAGQSAPPYGHHRGHSHSAARRDFERQASRPLDERLDKLFTMTKLNGRKPAAMLAAMLEVCPLGEKNSSHLYITMSTVFDIKH